MIKNNVSIQSDDILINKLDFKINNEEKQSDRITETNLDLFKMNQIIPRLYLSDDIAARNKDLLAKHKISHILNVTVNIPNKYDTEIVYMKLTILDMENQNIRQYFDEAIEFIDNALKDKNNSVLVHCNAGISRSASFVIAYLIKKGICKSYKDAYEHVKKCRPIISPNKGFVRQLQCLSSPNDRTSKWCILS